VARASDWVDGTGSRPRAKHAYLYPEHDAEPAPPIGFVAPATPMRTVKCEGCGSELQIPVRIHVYACPEPGCRGNYWYPCDVCTEDKRKCKAGKGKCTLDDGHYVEAVKITRGGTR